MKRIIKTLLIFIIFIVAVFSIAYYNDKNLKYYTPKTMKDQMQIMVKEVAVVESFNNEFIQVIPENNNVLLISVIEAYNTTGVEIDPDGYFEQHIKFKKKDYPFQMFSVYKGKIQNNKKRYLYLISELPYEIIQKDKIKGVDVAFSFGGEKKHFADKINNEYGFQDLITNISKKIVGYNQEFEQYWIDDMRGFRELSSKRAGEKNYKYIYNFIESLQREYQFKIEVLEVNLEQMKELNLITPIYPDANIKLIKDAILVKNKLEAIAELENTIDSKSGLDAFLDKATENLEIAEEKNKQALKDLAKDVKNEKREL